ncbi:MAG: S41 family peptidase [Bacteroidota bacterium]
MTKLQQYLPLLLAIVAVIGMIFGMRLQSSLVSDGYLSEEPLPEVESINQALQHIQSKYYGDLDQGEFTNEVLGAIVENLDGFSYYFEATHDTMYARYMKGLYRGIGIEFLDHRDTFYITDIIPGGPADEVGIEAGDVLLALEGVPLTDGIVDRDSVLRISDLPDGDTLELSIMDGRTSVQSEVSIIVGNVDIPLVRDYLIDTEEIISYVRIERFYEGVFRDFMEALDQHAAQGASTKRLIIDLRDNPGGIVDETVKILNQLIKEKNQRLISTIDNRGKVKTYDSNGRGFLDVQRIAVLVNEHSASASEILAAVLQDHDRAVVIGSQTYGKGVIQQNYNLANRGSINLTIGAYQLPSGRYISTASTDSIYYTLQNHRPIADGPAVQPDITLDACDTRIRNYDLLKRSMIDQDLWHTPLLAENRRLLTAGIYEATPSDSCFANYEMALEWFMTEQQNSFGDTLTITQVDPWIERAVKIISSPRYDEILAPQG